jgi:hypothetical protein
MAARSTASTVLAHPVENPPRGKGAQSGKRLKVASVNPDGIGERWSKKVLVGPYRHKTRE